MYYSTTDNNDSAIYVYKLIRSDSKHALEHHGIKGQKWGVRRFQNEDGTRTATGLKREHTDRINKTSINSDSYKEERNRQIKKGLKIAGVVLATGATMYAVHKTGIDRKAFETIKSIMPYDKGKRKGVFTKEVNPNYKTAAEKAKEAMAKEVAASKVKQVTSVVEKNSHIPVTNVKKEPSEAVKAILDANQLYRMKREIDNGTVKVVGRKTGLSDRERRVMSKLYSSRIAQLQRQYSTKSVSNLNRDAQKFMNFTDQLINQFA